MTERGGARLNALVRGHQVWPSSNVSCTFCGHVKSTSHAVERQRVVPMTLNVSDAV